MPDLLRELRYGLRQLLKTPLVAGIAILSLVLGIGANTAIFGVMNALLLRSLPVRDPQRLVSIGGIDPEHPEHGEDVSLAMFNEIGQRATVFSNVFVWTGGGIANFEARGVRYTGSLDEVSGDYFSVLGIRPVLGRFITRDDAPLDRRRSASVAVIGYGCWLHRFAGDPNVIGKMIRVEDTPATIIGVSPRNFTGLLIDVEPEATVPIGFTGRELKYRENLWFSLFGRLKPDFSIAQARTEIQAIWPSILKATAPDTFQGSQRARFFNLRPDVRSAARGASFLRERLEKPLEILMTVVAAVLLIACVNLANLLFARISARQHEFSVRVALGASRWPLIRMTLIEALLLSSAGALFGLFLAQGTARYLLASFWIGYVPLELDPTPDIDVLVFSTIMAVFTGLLFGIVPAWRMSRSDAATALSQSVRTTSGRTGRTGRLLVTAQVALSLILLMGASLFVRSLQKLRTVDLGYRRDDTLLMQLFPQAGHEKIPNRTAYFRELVTRLGQLPGVESVSYTHVGPASGYEYKLPVSTGTGGVANAVEEWAGPGFFRTMGMQVLAGREFTWRDEEHAPHVAIVSKSLAQALFPNQNPIGRIVNIGNEPEHQGLTVVGVVNNASLWKFQSHEPLAVYHALMQEPTYNQPRAVIRTLNEPARLAHLAERTLDSLGYHHSLRTETLEERTSRALVLERMIATLASGFSLLALLLAGVGLYGVTSYAVTRRSAEIGVRMALGAGHTDVLRMILREVFHLIAVGILIALPVALASGKLASNLLFGVSVTDPAAIFISASILTSVAAIAGFLPAYRAARVDPMIALRFQ